jgi:hypothetical protein
VGIVTTSIGVTVASLGIPSAMDGDGETSMPLLLAGGLTAGTGIAMTAVGAEAVTARRQSEERVLGGAILAGAGSTAIGLGVAWRNAGALGTGLWVGGAAAVTAGLAMVVTGAQEADEAPPAVSRARFWQAARGERVPRSPGRATAGMVLTFAGIAVAGAGGVATAALWEDTDGLVLFGSGPAMGTGALLIGIGIPLWATGAALVPAAELEEDASLRPPQAAPREVASRGRMIPDVAIGPGSVTARWTF